MQFQSKDFVTEMQTNTPLKEELYNKICNKVIMKYKDPNSVIVEDAVIESESEEDAGENTENA